MPEASRIDLSRYRLQKARDMPATAQRDWAAADYASANNRAYYCSFHTMRAVLALDGEDYKKHSAVIARFAVNYLKTDVLSREYGKLISNASLIRNRSDYEDFYICSVTDTEKLLTGAGAFYVYFARGSPSARRYTSTLSEKAVHCRGEEVHPDPGVCRGPGGACRSL